MVGTYYTIRILVTHIAQGWMAVFQSVQAQKRQMLTYLIESQVSYNTNTTLSTLKEGRFSSLSASNSTGRAAENFLSMIFNDDIISQRFFSLDFMLRVCSQM